MGVNTGEVIVGSVGETGRHREDTAMGEGVALAARMETAAEPGRSWSAHNIPSGRRPKFEWQPLGEIAVKGVSKPVAVYRPLARRALRRLPGRQTMLALPLVGRPRALRSRRSRAAWKHCAADAAGIALVTGEKGMGKSLLVGHVRQHFAQITGICPDEAPPRRTATLSPP